MSRTRAEVVIALTAAWASQDEAQDAVRAIELRAVEMVEGWLRASGKSISGSRHTIGGTAGHRPPPPPPPDKG